MKLILLAAAAVIATPALAQTTPSTTPSTTTDQTTPPATPQTDTATPQTDTAPPAATPTTDPAMQNQPSSTMPPAQTTAPMATTTTGDPVGGYQPSAPAMSGPMQPGATVTYQQAPSPDQAYPAPAPLAKYPMCKPGQFDKCMQGAGSTHSRQVHRRARRR